MKEKEIIIEEIKQLFANDSSGHDYWHTIRVYKSALKISEYEQCDARVVALAALLHDVDDAKLFSTDNYENARRIMKKALIDDETAEEVVKIIRIVSFRGTESVVPETTEGKVVQDADRLDAMGAIGIARAFAYGGNTGRCMYDPEVKPDMEMDADAYIGNRGTTINHFFEKLFHLKKMMNTETAKKIAEERDAFMHSYLETFLGEWEGI